MLLLSGSVVFGFSVAKSDTLQIRADAWCPYNCAPKSAMPGYMIEILEKYATQNGHTINYETMPWARALSETRAGSIDGVVGLGPQDATGLVISEKLGVDVSCFFVKKDSAWTFNGIPDLDKIKMVATIQDYVYADSFQKWVDKNKNKVDPGTGDNPLETNFKKLMADRFDTVLDNENVVGYFIKQNPQFAGTKVVGCLEQTPVFIGLSSKKAKSKEHIEKINLLIKEMRKNGEMDALGKKYGVSI